MGKIKDFMMDAYYKYEEGMSIEDIAKLYNVDVEMVKNAIETQKQIEKHLDEEDFDQRWTLGSTLFLFRKFLMGFNEVWGTERRRV